MQQRESDLLAELEKSDRLSGKLKEDAGLIERELGDLRQDKFDLERQQERNALLEAQVRQLSFHRDFRGHALKPLIFISSVFQTFQPVKKQTTRGGHLQFISFHFLAPMANLLHVDMKMSSVPYHHCYQEGLDG